ncbi:hypothetical protein PR048_008979 [Dryococelus australis]|uniref:Uncharacterized protein n=1 Tax=Dryococelus australis TaxID=614101 RepID=A0ABQ9HZP2_9NEOP|nr:hypothetical protein PR048_008979 [Dryococelus australis]
MGGPSDIRPETLVTMRCGFESRRNSSRSFTCGVRGGRFQQLVPLRLIHASRVFSSSVVTTCQGHITAAHSACEELRLMRDFVKTMGKSPRDGAVVTHWTRIWGDPGSIPGPANLISALYGFPKSLQTNADHVIKRDLFTGLFNTHSHVLLIAGSQLNGACLNNCRPVTTVRDKSKCLESTSPPNEFAKHSWLYLSAVHGKTPTSRTGAAHSSKMAIRQQTRCPRPNSDSVCARAVPTEHDWNVCSVHRSAYSALRTFERTANSLSPSKTGVLANIVRGGVVVRLLASHQGEPGSIPCGAAPRFPHCGIVSDDAAGGFSRGSPISIALAFQRCFIFTPLHPHRILRPRLHTWESRRARPLVGGFSRGSPVPHALISLRCSILTSVNPPGGSNYDSLKVPKPVVGCQGTSLCKGTRCDAVCREHRVGAVMILARAVLSPVEVTVRDGGRWPPSELSESFRLELEATCNERKTARRAWGTMRQMPSRLVVTSERERQNLLAWCG